MKLLVKKGSTSKLIDLFILDSSSTTGAGLTGLAYNTASLTAYYYREGAASAVAITLATMTLGTWASGGFVVVDGTNMPGVYQLGIPNAAIASGADSVVVLLKGAANMAPVVLEIQLVDFDPADATRLGLAALPNAAAAASGGLPTVGTGSGQLNLSGGRADANVLRWNGTAVPAENTAGYPIVTVKDGTGVGEIDTTSGGVLVAGYASGQTPLQPTVAGRTLDVSAGGEAGIDWANIGSPATAVNLSATNIDTDQVVASVAGAVGSVTSGVTVTTNNDKTGYGLSAAAVQAIWDALSSALTTVGSIGKRIVDNLDAAVSSRLATAGYTTPPTAVAIADQVWDEALAGHLSAGSTGAALNAAGAAGDPWATALPGAYGAGTAGNIVGNRLDAAVSTRLASASYSAAPSAATVADAVWDEALAGHLAAGSTGAALSTAGSGSSASAIADAVWDEAIAGHLTAGSAGAKLDAAASGSGTGAIAFTYTVTSSATGLPLDGVEVVATTDSAGQNVAGRGTTDAFGEVVFYLDPGTYYFWSSRTGYVFTNPDTEVVS